jgi:hypothetical protein
MKNIESQNMTVLPIKGHNNEVSFRPPLKNHNSTKQCLTANSCTINRQKSAITCSALKTNDVRMSKTTWLATPSSSSASSVDIPARPTVHSSSNEAVKKMLHFYEEGKSVDGDDGDGGEDGIPLLFSSSLPSSLSYMSFNEPPPSFATLSPDASSRSL